MIEVSGVRSSWLSVEVNSFLMRSASICRVTSWPWAMTETMSPSGLTSGVTVHSHTRAMPSRRGLRILRPARGWRVSVIRIEWPSNSACNSGSTRRLTCPPISSPAAYPNRSSAAWLTAVTMPWGSISRTAIGARSANSASLRPLEPLVQHAVILGQLAVRVAQTVARVEHPVQAIGDGDADAVEQRHQQRDLREQAVAERGQDVSERNRNAGRVGGEDRPGRGVHRNAARHDSGQQEGEKHLPLVGMRRKEHGSPKSPGDAGGERADAQPAQPLFALRQFVRAAPIGEVKRRVQRAHQQQQAAPERHQLDDATLAQLQRRDQADDDGRGDAEG